MGETDAAGPGDVTRLLGSVRAGKREALDQLLPLVYDELRGLARAQVRRGFDASTLHPTALVHEAYLKLAGAGRLEAGSRAHFLSIAARAMRQVLLDRARAARAGKRGGDWHPTTLLDGHAPIDVGLDDMLAMNEALESLDPRQRQVVECRFFAGMEEAEIAEALGVSDRTVRREWVRARAWLLRALLPSPDAAAPAP